MVTVVSQVMANRRSSSSIILVAEVQEAKELIQRVVARIKVGTKGSCNTRLLLKSIEFDWRWLEGFGVACLQEKLPEACGLRVSSVAIGGSLGLPMHWTGRMDADIILYSPGERQGRERVRQVLKFRCSLSLSLSLSLSPARCRCQAG